MKRLLALIPCLTILGVGCAGDLGAEGRLPTCNARPNDPAGYEFTGTQEIEGSDHGGRTYGYRGPGGEEVTFFFGVPTDAAAGLPQVGQLPLATIGAGRLLGQGGEWALAWRGQPPCDPMTVVGTGFTRKSFIQVLGQAHVIPPEEEEGEAGVDKGVEGGIEEEPEDEASEGVLPPGGPTVEWVAVFETARDPNDLERIQRELLDTVPHNVAVSPVTCWKGLAAQLGVPRDRYVAGVVAVTSNELDFVVERVGLTPTFFGQLRARCLD